MLAFAAVMAAALPLGDGHVGTTPRAGWVDSCQTSFHGGGAQADGPWIDAQAGTWDRSAKLHVRGDVRRAGASYRVTTAGTRRRIASAGLPTNHGTGTFPIAGDDPAFAYDRNPNRIAARGVSWSLPRSPRVARSPRCTSLGAIGILSDGVVLYNALDAAGRDAGAHEVLDACDGHPDPSSTYHHHAVPSCILDRAPKGRATLAGYARDGFGIYVVKDARGALPSDADLDACHGRTSAVRWNGRRQRVYHYVATLEYPYSIGCFRGSVPR